jgi:hypothetical protein
MNATIPKQEESLATFEDGAEDGLKVVLAMDVTIDRIRLME